MKSSPLPHTSGLPVQRRATDGVSSVAKAVGALVMAFGVGLAGLTLAGAADGFAAIGFYDIAVGGMFLAFSWCTAKFGYEVMTGRQTMTGEVLG